MTRALMVSCTLLSAGCSILADTDTLRFETSDGGDADAAVDVGDAGPPPLGVPTLQWPPNGWMTGSPSAEGSRMPRFTWSADPGADHYEIALSADCMGPSPDQCSFEVSRIFPTREPEWRPMRALPVDAAGPVGTRYAWRVRSCRSELCERWSEAHYVDVGRTRGDFTGDGRADLLASGRPASNVVYAYWGTSWSFPKYPPFPTEIGIPPTPELWTFGQAIASIGDVNADGFGDVAIGAPEDALSTADADRVSIFRGEFNNLRSHATLQVPDARAFGRAIAGGDINGDGRSDLFVAALEGPGDAEPETGVVYVFLADPTGELRPIEPPLRSSQPRAQGRFGQSISASGDIDGDGFIDLVVGAPGENDGSGSIHVFHGGRDFGARAATVIDALPPLAGFGSAVTVADFNGDDFADIHVLAVSDAAIVRGGPTFAGTYRDVRGPAMSSLRGTASGDYDGDGVADLAVFGSVRTEPSDLDADTAWIQFGMRDASSEDPEWFEPPRVVRQGRRATNDASFADFDGDGISELVVSSPNDPPFSIQVCRGTGNREPICGEIDAPDAVGMLFGARLVRH